MLPVPRMMLTIASGRHQDKLAGTDDEHPPGNVIFTGRLRGHLLRKLTPFQSDRIR
jgi:hypothetical protein